MCESTSRFELAPRSSPKSETSRAIAVGSAGELAPGQRKLAFIGGRSIVVFNIGGSIQAIDNSCPHNGASLAGGKLEGNMLQCPAHGLRFDLMTGRMPGGGLRVRTFPVRVVDGSLVVTVDESPVDLRSGTCGANEARCGVGIRE